MKNIFIGGINLKNNPEGGEEAKNQQILKYFNQNNIEVKVIDTHNWKKRIFTLIPQIIYTCLFLSGKNIYLSVNHRSAFKLIQFLVISGVAQRNNIHYFVVGGIFDQWLENNPKKIGYYTHLKRIYPETKGMVNTLQEIGLQNVTETPNFKYFPPSFEIKKEYSPIRFLFLSRITPFKGVSQILEAVEKLNVKGFKNLFTVDFYGYIDSDYEDFFHERCNTLPNVTYKGFMDLSKEENYTQLSQYNMMLFPSFWPGEGFPGVFIDALIAEIPILASDWHHNKEIISHGINGIIVPVKDVEALTKAMEDIINNPEFLKKLEKGVKNTKHKYNIEEVLKNIIEQNDNSRDSIK